MPITVRSVSPNLLVSACRWLLHVCQSVLLWAGLCSELTPEQLVVTIIPSIVVAAKKVKAALPENRPVHMKAVLHSSGQTVEVGDLAVERTLALPILSRRAVLVRPKLREKEPAFVVLLSSRERAKLELHIPVPLLLPKALSKHEDPQLSPATAFEVLQQTHLPTEP